VFSTMEPNLLARRLPRSEHDPDLEQQQAATNTNLAMHPVTGAFRDASLESEVAAQIFRLAFPAHMLLWLSLTLAVGVWIVLVADPELRVIWGVVLLCAAVGLVGRVLLHRLYDSARAQKTASSTWVLLLALPCLAATVFDGVRASRPLACVQKQKDYLGAIVYLTTVLINGSLGMGFARKVTLAGLILANQLVTIALCGEAALAPMLCEIAVVLLGAFTAHMAELYWRHSYTDKVMERRRVAEAERRREEEKQQVKRRASVWRASLAAGRGGHRPDRSAHRGGWRRAVRPAAHHQGSPRVGG